MKQHNEQAERDRFLARIERQIAEQNALLAAAVAGNPELERRFAQAIAFKPVARKSVAKLFNAVRA